MYIVHWNETVSGLLASLSLALFSDLPGLQTLSSTPELPTLKVTPDLHGCPPEKNSYPRRFKGKHGKLYIVGKLNKWRFWEKYELPVSSIRQKKIAKNHENDHVSFIQ